MISEHIRIIPRLDIKGPNLVKGINLEGLRVMGTPEQFAAYYYQMGADELLYMDIVASLYNRNSLYELIAKAARDIFVPLTVGGGIRSIYDIRMALRSGADKVSLNTIAIKNPGIIKEAATEFGSSTIVVSIEAIRQPGGEYLAFTDSGREYTGVEVQGWAKRVQELGAGEILITAIDREGTGKGFDIDLTRMVSESVSIPVIACGGASEPRHIEEVIKEGKADAVAIASMLHYDFLKHNYASVNLDSNEGNKEFLINNRDFSGVKSAGIPEIKEYVLGRGIKCRWN